MLVVLPKLPRKLRSLIVAIEILSSIACVSVAVSGEFPLLGCRRAIVAVPVH